MNPSFTDALAAIRQCVSVVALLATAQAAYADCVEGTRRGTAEEKAYARKLTAALRAALPAAPAPTALEYEPTVNLQAACKDTPVGEISGLIIASYAASLNYTDRVKLMLRVNFPFPSDTDLVLGSLPKKPAGFKVHNVVVKFEGHEPQYLEAVKQALDRGQLQALIDQPLPDTPPPVAWTVGKPGESATRAAAPAASATPTATAAATPAAAEQRGAPAPQPDPVQSTADKTLDTINKLRGLLGR